MRWIWHNGRFKPEAEARVSIYDSAMMFGDTCFEMMRTFNRKTFMLKEHIDRLFASCRELEIPMNYSEEEICLVHETLLATLIAEYPKEDEWRTLVNVSRGILPLYQEMIGESGTEIMIACFPLRHILKGRSGGYTKGVYALTPSQRAIPHHLLDARLKTRSRQHYMIANLEVARQDRDAWALLFDPDGFIAEGTGSNFFMVDGSCRLMTPYGRNCLRGISRQYVIDNTDAVEADITLYDVMNAKEAFFTCTPYSIMPITKVNGRPIGTGRPGRRTGAIIEKWIRDVDCDFVAQALKWDRQ